MPRLRRELEKAKGKIGDRSEVRMIDDDVDEVDGDEVEFDVKKI